MKRIKIKDGIEVIVQGMSNGLKIRLLYMGGCVNTTQIDAVQAKSEAWIKTSVAKMMSEVGL